MKIMKRIKNHWVPVGILLLSIISAWFAAMSFENLRENDPIHRGPGVTEIRQLSDYFPGIRNTNGDTPVYIMKGEAPGGATLVLGGTHPNEPASHITAVCLIELCLPRTGTLIVIPRANNSAFTHNDPQEANPQSFAIGKRSFRFGSRSTNPIDQWPDPEVYRHHPSGQKLSGSETRNLNRSYPGKPDGSLTEKVAFAIMQVMEQEHVDIAFDLHEASPEYPVINAIVTHPISFDLSAEAVLYLQMEGIEFNLEPSPENFRGLSHREWGDALQISSILMESANPVQGRYHGRLTDDAVTSGIDHIYSEAYKHGLLEVPFPEEGIPMEVRVGRHLSALNQIYQIWSEYQPDKAIELANIPDYHWLQENGLASLLDR